MTFPKLPEQEIEFTPAELEVLPSDQCIPNFDRPEEFNSLTPVTEGSWKNNTPTRRVYKYPPAADNPGRVTDGTAEHMRKQAEAYHKGPQWQALAALRRQRPSKAVRRARAVSL